MPETLLVSLVRPPIVSTTRAFNNEATPCIGFAYISGFLQSKGYQVKIVDAIAEALNRFWDIPEFPGYHCQGLTIDEIIERIDPRSRIVGFSAMFSGEWPITRATIKAVRRKFPDALLVAGGEHITALTEYSLRECPELDVCVRGEGEQAMYEICEAYRTGKNFSEVGGGAYLDVTGMFVEVAPNRIREIDEIPWPDWPGTILSGRYPRSSPSKACATFRRAANLCPTGGYCGILAAPGVYSQRTNVYYYNPGPRNSDHLMHDAGRVCQRIGWLRVQAVCH